MTIYNIDTNAELIDALATAVNGDELHFAPGDYTGVLITIADNRDLTFTSANADIDPSTWLANTEVVLNRISSNGSVTVNGIHVHQTARSAGFADGNWEAIVTATAGESLKVSHSRVTIDARSDSAPGQAFGVVATYNTQSIEVDHVHFGPYLGAFDPTLANYGVYVSGSSDPSNTISITNNEFEAGTTRNVGVKLAAQVGGPQVVIEGNSFEEPGTAQGAIRIDDEGQNFPGPQDFSGISENQFHGDGKQISNETGGPIINNGSDSVVGTSADETFVANGGNDSIDGGGGNDTIDMVNAGSSGSVVSLAGFHIASSGATGIDTLVSIENVRGSSGNDFIIGDDGANVIYATTGSDTIDAGGEIDTYDASAASVNLLINLQTDTVSGTGYSGSLTNIENATGGSGNDIITGQTGQANALAGGGGSDTFKNLGSGDTADGGGGIDTADFSSVARGAATIESGSGGTFTVRIGGQTATLTNIGVLHFNDIDVVVVGAGSDYTTIQAGVNAATGDVHEVLILNGTYTEQVTIAGKSDLLVNAESDGGVTIKAPSDVVETARSSTNRVVHSVVTVTNGTDVQLKNITVDGDGRANTVDQVPGSGEAQYTGVFFRNSSGGLEGVDITHIRDPYESGSTPGGHHPVISGMQRGVGLQVDNGGSTRLKFSMSGGSISDFQKNATVFNNVDLDIHGVAITGGGDQTINAQNGIQATNSTGSISGNTITGIGYAGAQDVYSGAVLIFDNISLDVTGDTIVGSNIDNPAARVVGVYVLNFGVGNDGGTISGNIISHVDVGVGVYGDMVNNAVVVGSNTISDLDMTDPLVASIDFEPSPSVSVPLSVDGGPGNDILHGGAAVDTIRGFGGADSIDGKGGNDILNGGEGNDSIDGSSGNDSIDGGTGDDTIDGGGDIDTVTGYGASYHLEIQGGKWVVTNGTDTDTLTNVEKVTVNGETYILVDSFADGGFGSVQAAIDSATGGETILIAPGNYTETANYNPTTGLNDPAFANPLGLLINKDGLVLQGVTATGAFINAAGSTLATILSGVQSNWGTNFFVTGDDITIKGLAFNGVDDGSGEINKVIEVVGDGFTLQHSVVGGLNGVEVASTVYINDQYATTAADFISAITSFLIDNNILEGALVVTNGPGTGHAAADVDFKITDNDFVMNTASDAGYNWGIILSGQEATIPWRLASILYPEITGNSFTGDYSVLLRALDDDPAKMPTRAYIDAFIANNIDGDYAFASEADGSPQMNASAANRFFIRSTLDAAVADAVSGGTVVFRAADDTSYTVNKDGLTFDAQDGSGAVTLQLGMANNVNLDGDQAVTVLGNGNANVINGNDGDNYITGGNGGDTISGGKGSDTIDAGSGSDTVVFSESFEDLTITRIGSTNNYIVANSTGDADAVLNVENFTINGVTVSAADAATNKGPEITSITNLQTGSILTVTEDTGMNAPVSTVAATDPNLTAGLGDHLTYSLQTTSGGEDFTGPFSIDPDNGEIRVSGPLDREGTSSYGVKVVVTDAHGNVASHDITIQLGDINDNSTVFTSGNTGSVNENAPTATVVYDAETTDADLGAITYTLSGADAGSLNVNANGQVRLNSSANFEAKSQYLFNVVATQGLTSASRAVTLSINDVNEGFGGLATQTVSIEAGSTQASLGLAALTDPQNDPLFYKVTTLPGQGTVFLNTGVAVGINQQLTEAQFLGLKYSSLETASNRGMQFLVTDGHGTSSTLNLNIIVTGAVNGTYTGNGLANRLDGAGGNDFIDGRGGADMMFGGSGNDRFVVDNAGDRVFEGVGKGTDLVYSSISQTLAANVESLVLTGTAANGRGNILNNQISGNASVNQLFGDAGNDTLYGYAGNDALNGGVGNDALNGGVGNDALNGGVGNDVLTGGANRDVFVFNSALNSTTNRDRIVDFSHADDALLLDNAIFSRLGGTGAMDARFFHQGTAAADANDYIIYNRTTGLLSYDADANGSGAAVAFAVLANRPTIAANDFVII